MAVGKFVFFLLTALVAVNLIFADNEPSQPGDQRDGADQEPSGRFFLNRFTSCNYTVAPGSSCTSCTTAIRCLPNNQGLVRTCRGFLRYCNGGRCSFLAPANCTGSG